jgi:hypothetical protein
VADGTGSHNSENFPKDRIILLFEQITFEFPFLSFIIWKACFFTAEKNTEDKNIFAVKTFFWNSVSFFCIFVGTAG